MLRRSVAAAVVAAVALSVTTMPTSAHAAAEDSAARWLTGELEGNLMHNDVYDVDDIGLTIDTGLALHELSERRTVRRIRGAVAPAIAGYTAPGDERYSGATAKALVWAQASGADPRSYGGVDLVRQLNSLVSTDAPTLGRIADRSEYGDFANTIGQAFAVRGLWNAKSRKRQAAFGYLLKQQCRAGYFRINLPAADAPSQTCNAGYGGKAADTDATAMAVLALKTLPQRSTKVRRSLRRATSWLRDHQKRNGSFTGGPSTHVSNANSTGLAAWALGEVGACGRAERAARWVRKIQVRGDVSGTPYAGDKGAVAYDRAAYRAGTADGITVEARDQWRRTTAQAAVGLRHLKGC